jgi:hypothetical protein
MDVILCLHSSPPTIKVKAKFLLYRQSYKNAGFKYTKIYTRSQNRKVYKIVMSRVINMRLTAEIESADSYDKNVIERLLDLKHQDSNQSKYNLKSSFLESIIGVKNNKGLVKLTDDNNLVTETIDIIVTPYKHNGKNVGIDDYGEFKEPENGIPLIEVRPKYVEIKPNELPDDVTLCKRNHEYIIFKFPSDKTCAGEPLDVMVNLFYKPKPAASTKLAKADNQAA